MMRAVGIETSRQPTLRARLEAPHRGAPSLSRAAARCKLPSGGRPPASTQYAAADGDSEVTETGVP